MIIRLITQIGTPQIIDIHPSSNRRDSSQKLAAIAIAYKARRQSRIKKRVLIFGQKRWTKERFIRARQTTTDDLSRRTATGACCCHNDVGVENDRNHVDSICAVNAINNQPTV